MPMKRNERRAIEEPEPLDQEPVVDAKKEARAAFLERKMGPRGAVRRYEKLQTRQRKALQTLTLLF